MLRWFAQGLGKGQLCVGSASLTSHHLPTSIISVKEHLEGRGSEIGRQCEAAVVELIQLCCQCGCWSQVVSWRGWYCVQLILKPGGGPFQVEYLSAVNSLKMCEVKADQTNVQKSCWGGRSPSLRTGYYFDLIKCFLHPQSRKSCSKFDHVLRHTL